MVLSQLILGVSDSYINKEGLTWGPVLCISTACCFWEYLAVWEGRDKWRQHHPYLRWSFCYPQLWKALSCPQWSIQQNWIHLELTFLEQDHKTCTDPLSSLQVFPYVSLRHSIYHCEGEKHILSNLYEIKYNKKTQDQKPPRKERYWNIFLSWTFRIQFVWRGQMQKSTNHADGWFLCNKAWKVKEQQ